MRRTEWQEFRFTPEQRSAAAVLIDKHLVGPADKHLALLAIEYSVGHLLTGWKDGLNNRPQQKATTRKELVGLWKQATAADDATRGLKECLAQLSEDTQDRLAWAPEAPKSSLDVEKLEDQIATLCEQLHDLILTLLIDAVDPAEQQSTHRGRHPKLAEEVFALQLIDAVQPFVKPSFYVRSRSEAGENDGPIYRLFRHLVESADPRAKHFDGTGIMLRALKGRGL